MLRLIELQHFLRIRINQIVLIWYYNIHVSFVVCVMCLTDVRRSAIPNTFSLAMPPRSDFDKSPTLATRLGKAAIFLFHH